LKSSGLQEFKSSGAQKFKSSGVYEFKSERKKITLRGRGSGGTRGGDEV
jgi:hypothetical protein